VRAIGQEAGCLAKHVQRFTYEFLDVRFPGRRARYYHGSIQGSYAKRPPRNPNGELPGGIVQVVSIAKQWEEMPGKGD
jgi:hypothetical protein